MNKTTKIKVYRKPEKCPFCGSYTVEHIMPVGPGPTRRCAKCHAEWTPLLNIEEPKAVQDDGFYDKDKILQRLEEIEKRAKRATPGPWESDGVRVYSKHSDREFGLVADCDLLPGPKAKESSLPADPDFIAHAREDIPWLCQVIRQLLERAKEER